MNWNAESTFSPAGTSPRSLTSRCRPFEVGAETIEDLPLALAGELGDHFGREYRSFDAGCLDDLPLAVAEPADAFLDHALHVCGQGVPIDVVGDPRTLVVLHQVATFLEGAQQLHGEQRMPTGTGEELRPCRGAEVVGLGVDQLAGELAPFVLGRHVEVDRDIAAIALDLGEHFRQRQRRRSSPVVMVAISSGAILNR